MTKPALSSSTAESIPVFCLTPGEIAGHDDISRTAKTWAETNGFDGQSGKVLPVPSQDGQIEAVLFGLGKEPQAFATGKLPLALPEGSYEFANMAMDAQQMALGWLLGAYQFSRYKKSGREPALLKPSGDIDEAQLVREAEATFLARDLINTPASDMGPGELEAAIRNLGKRFKAEVSVVKGDDLLKENFPMIHAVGRASADAPRLVDLRWGNEGDPKVTLVGKGVIFDTGGLNIKPGGSMELMKKDMGGAANVIALAQMIMDAKLPVRLRLLVPAVENAISGNAFRPGDILPSRKGISVEIGNTDAEGRLVLGDALALGDEETPDMMIDMATLTGAARVALGPDLPPFYTDDDELAGQLNHAALAQHDPLWRMPLWPPYQKMLSSKIADVNHISKGGHAGSITAALFLSRFVENTPSWVHFDIFGWVPAAKPWAPMGGEAQGIRALFQVIQTRYGS